MKDKLMLVAVMAITSFPILAGGGGGGGLDGSPSELPEPGTLGLFAAAAIAITIVAKLKK